VKKNEKIAKSALRREGHLAENAQQRGKISCTVV